MITRTTIALTGLPNQSMDATPKTFSRAFTGPVCGATSKSFWNMRATATVGMMTGKNTRVRTTLPRLRRTKT